MADLSKWDDDYGERVIEYLYGLDKEVLIDWVIGMMTDGQVDDLIDAIEESERGY